MAGAGLLEPYERGFHAKSCEWLQDRVTLQLGPVVRSGGGSGSLPCLLPSGHTPKFPTPDVIRGVFASGSSKTRTLQVR